MVEAPRSMAVVSFNVTFKALTTDTAPVKLLALFSVMLFAAPAVNVLVPVTLRDPAPLSLIPPALVVIPSVPPTVLAPAPVKSTSPPALTLRLPVMFTLPRLMAFVSTSVALLPLTTITVLKSLAALFSRMSPLPAVNVVLPLTVSAAVVAVIVSAVIDSDEGVWLFVSNVTTSVPPAKLIVRAPVKLSPRSVIAIFSTPPPPLIAMPAVGLRFVARSMISTS